MYQYLNCPAAYIDDYSPVTRNNNKKDYQYNSVLWWFSPSKSIQFHDMKLRFSVETLRGQYFNKT
jgi:hypothetical protein